MDHRKGKGDGDTEMVTSLDMIKKGKDQKGLIHVGHPLKA